MPQVKVSQSLGGTLFSKIDKAVLGRLFAALRRVIAPVSTALAGSKTYDPGSLADGAGETTTVTVTGAALGDMAICSFSLDLQGMTQTAYVSAANTVSVRTQNESGGLLDLASGTLRVVVFKAGAFANATDLAP